PVSACPGLHATGRLLLLNFRRRLRSRGQLAEKPALFLFGGLGGRGFGGLLRRHYSNRGRFRRRSWWGRRRCRGNNPVEQAGRAGNKPVREQWAGVQMAALLGLGTLEEIIGFHLRGRAEWRGGLAGGGINFYGNDTERGREGLHIVVCRQCQRRFHERRPDRQRGVGAFDVQ